MSNQDRSHPAHPECPYSQERPREMARWYEVEAAKLAKSNEELRQFAYAASHDLREPLGKIKAFGKRLEERSGPALDDKGRDYLGIMLSAADRMSNLIDDLLEYSMVEKNGVPDTPVDLSAVLAEVFSLFSEKLVGAEIHCDTLPVVRGDETQIYTLFQNLIGNAIKFRKPDGPVRIWVTGDESPKESVVTVRDEGIGFEQEHAEKIFRVFERLHTRFNYPGTGIGLALCKRIVERHEGSISAVGTPGVGAEFRIVFPKRGEA